MLVVFLAVAAVLVYYTVREYQPDEIETIEAENDGTESLLMGDTCTILTYNTGYAALSSEEDFFMDGGSKVRPDSRELVEENLVGIASIQAGQDADILEWLDNK